jgi:multiple sugar transport system substrate-binding protein
LIKYMSSEGVAKAEMLTTGQAHVNRALYSDPDIPKKFPHFPILLKSTETANPRPKVVKCGDATLAMQDAAYSAIQGQVTPGRAQRTAEQARNTHRVAAAHVPAPPHIEAEPVHSN